MARLSCAPEVFVRREGVAADFNPPGGRMSICRAGECQSAGRRNKFRRYTQDYSHSIVPGGFEVTS